jgi:hypothetical protein
VALASGLQANLAWFFRSADHLPHPVELFAKLPRSAVQHQNVQENHGQDGRKAESHELEFTSFQGILPLIRMRLAAKSVDFPRHLALLHPHHRDHNAQAHQR